MGHLPITLTCELSIILATQSKSTEYRMAFGGKNNPDFTDEINNNIEK
jgi:hypothetical protein